jgi:hypothetical protein
MLLQIGCRASRVKVPGFLPVGIGAAKLGYWSVVVGGGIALYSAAAAAIRVRHIASNFGGIEARAARVGSTGTGVSPDGGGKPFPVPSHITSTFKAAQTKNSKSVEMLFEAPDSIMLIADGRTPQRLASSD